MKFWMSPFFEKFQLELDNNPIPTVNKTKFLGVIIDDKLKWTDHINNVISKISTNKNLIGRYKWSSSLPNKQIKAIDTAQKYCILAISKAPRDSPTEPLYKLLRIIKFTELRKYELLLLTVGFQNTNMAW